MADYEKLYRDLVAKYNGLADELRLEKIKNEGLTADNQSWLQMKVARQGKALTTLQRRVENQRFCLRTLEEMGRSLTREEFLTARGDRKDHAGADLELVEV